MAYLSSQRFFYRSVLVWIIRRPLVVLALGSALTFFFTFKISTLSFRASAYDLLIEDLSETARYEAFKKEYGHSV